MIKEAIAFVKKFEADQTQQENKEDWRGKKFLIVNTKEKEGQLVYYGFEVLGDDEDIRLWLDNHEHYTSVITNLAKYTKPIVNEKAIGSNSGFLSMSFFLFRLSKKNIEGFNKKLEKVKFKEEFRNSVAKIREIKELLLKLKKDANLEEKEKDEKGNEKGYKYLDYFVVVYVNKNLLDKWVNLNDDFIEERYSAGRSNQKTIEGICVSCLKKSNLATPIFLTSYDGEKKFLLHKTRMSKDEQGTPLLICSECIQKLNLFEKILKENKIKIFPLFINKNEIDEEIKIIKGDLDKDSNTFADIFKKLEQRIKKDIFDFYLVVMSGNYFSFDYVSGYKWELGNYTPFFGKEENSYIINRQVFEIKICEVLTNGDRIDYFNTGKDNKQFKKFKDNQQATLAYSLRQKLFDFVYRNQNAFTSADLEKIVLFRIEKEIKNGSAKKSQCREFLNLYFNKHLSEGKEMEKENMLLNKVKPMKEAIASGKYDSFDIKNDEEWAYWTGQLAYYLIYQSKTKDKTFGLLEPFTNKSTTNLVKITIKELFEKYKHEVFLTNQRFKAIASKVLAYTINKSFLDLKIYFYVGVFDDNIIFLKKEKDETKEGK